MAYGKHWTLIADAEGATGLTGRQLFMEALFRRRGMRSDAIRQTAAGDHELFITNGNAPDYVVNYCIDKINAQRNRAKAVKLTQAERFNREFGPSQSGVEELTDCA